MFAEPLPVEPADAADAVGLPALADGFDDAQPASARPDNASAAIATSLRRLSRSSRTDDTLPPAKFNVHGISGVATLEE